MRQFIIGGNLNEEPSRSKGESSGIVMDTAIDASKYSYEPPKGG